MDHSPIRQTFELGKFISTAGKSIVNLVKLRSIQYFSTKRHNFTKFMMLIPAVLMNFPNSKVCLIGEWSIVNLGRTAETNVDSCSLHVDDVFVNSIIIQY